MRIIGGAALLIALGLISGCKDFPSFDAVTCGNAVIDEGEDCDSFPFGKGTICRAPGTEGECRFDCTPAPEGEATGACPAGYVCSQIDSICRAPTGEFSAGPTVVDEGIQKVLLGDFDGDGQKDALTVSAAVQRVHFFDEQGARVTTTDVPGTLQRPAVGRLSGKDDRIDDFTNIAGIGVSVLRGQENRSIAPTHYELAQIEEQSRYSLFAIDSDPTEEGPEVMGIFQNPNESTFSVRVLNFDGSVSAPLNLSNSDIPGALTGEAAVADLFSPLSSEVCDEAVFGFTTADHVIVLSPCATNPALKEQKISLNGQGFITGAPQIADMNNDGSLDIVVGGFAKHVTQSLTEEFCHFVGVAYNTGAGGFGSDPAGAPDAKAALIFDYFAEDTDSCAVPEGEAKDHAFLRPLAAGDVNGDGVGDYVDPAGIHLSIPIPGTSMIAGFGEPIRLVDTFWTTAIIADVTADGIADVIAGSEIVPGIDFFQNSGNAAAPLNYATIPAEYPVASLKTGYFDADLVRDVVFAERKLLDPSLPPNSSGDELAVLFGRALAPPEPPTRFGRMSRIQQVLVTNFSGLTIPTEDAMTDVLVLTGQDFPETIDKPMGMPPKPAETKHIFVLPGNGERLLLSPFRLLAPHVALPIHTAVGQFHGGAGSPDDLTVFGIGDRPELWLLPVLDEGQFASPFNGTADGSPVTTASPLTFELGSNSELELDDRLVEFVVANLDGGDTDEIIAFIPTDDLVSPVLYLVVARTGDVTAEEGTFPGWKVEPAEKLEGLSLPLHIEAGDIDGDSLEDIAGVFLEKPEKKASLPPAQIAVYLSKAGGGFDKVPIAIPRHMGLRPEDAFDDRPWAVAILNADKDPEKEVAIFSTARMYLADFDPTTRTFPEPVEIMEVGGTAAVAGDVTGDGIDDIVVSDGTNLRVLAAVSP